MKSNTYPIDISALVARLPITALSLLLSCLFSLIVIVQHPLLNDDAYGYLRAAELFNAEGARTMLESFPWYHYSILIALADYVLPGGLILAAHVLNTLLYALLTYAFLLLSKELRDTPRTQLFAAVCILAFPLVNEMRYFLIRDTGFWAFALLSLVCLIRHNRSGDTRMAFRWSLALVAATAFRLEGLLLLALAPWSLLLPDPSLAMKERAERCGRLVGILAAVVLSVLIVTMLAGLSLPDQAAYAYRWYLLLLADLSPLLNGTAASVGAALFTADNFPGSGNTTISFVIVLFGYVLALTMNLVEALGLPLVILLVAGRVVFGRFALPVQTSRALGTYVTIATLALLLFVFIMHFLTQRYATLLALLVLIRAPLILDELYARAQTSAARLKRFHVYFAVIAFVFLVDSLFSFGYSSGHVDNGIAWTQEQLPEDARMKTNNFAIAYHSKRVADYDKTERDAGSVLQSSVAGDYLVLEVDHDDETVFLDTHPQLTQLARFTNERGDEVRVYLRR